METEQRHLQMLLTVSSFGESLRRLCRRRHFLTTNPAAWFYTELFFFLCSLNGFSNHRQDNKERTALPHCRFHPNTSLMAFHNIFDNRQTKSGPLDLRVDIGAAIELIENF